MPCVRQADMRQGALTTANIGPAIVTLRSCNTELSLDGLHGGRTSCSKKLKAAGAQFKRWCADDSLVAPLGSPSHRVDDKITL